MGAAGAFMALSAVQGITSRGQGYAQSAEDKANASLYSQQAQLEQIQGNIQQGQLATKGGQILSTQTADAAAKGLMPTGSIAAVMLNSQTQIQTDMAISRFNTTMAVNRSNAQANAQVTAGQLDVFSGYSSAFSDLLTGASKAYAYSNKINTN